MRGLKRRLPIRSLILACGLFAAALALSLAASAAAFVEEAECPCWGAGGPFGVPGYCAAPGPNRFAWSSAGPVFVQHVALGALSYCRVNGFFAWTTPAQYQACSHSLQVACSETFAVAYTDRNRTDVFDRGDDLIAKLVDANGSGEPDAGDVTVADVFPLATGPGGATGSFGTKAVACANLSVNPNGLTCGNADGTSFTWDHGVSGESFRESGGFGTEVQIRDLFSAANPDEIFVRDDFNTVLDPDPGDVDENSADTGDQDFIDVDVLVDLPPPA